MEPEPPPLGPLAPARTAPLLLALRRPSAQTRTGKIPNTSVALSSTTASPPGSLSSSLLWGSASSSPQGVAREKPWKPTPERRAKEDSHRDEQRYIEDEPHGDELRHAEEGLRTTPTPMTANPREPSRRTTPMS
jgi:hypothetical protein